MGKGGIVFGFILMVVSWMLFPSLLTAFDKWGYTEVSTIAAITTEGNTTGSITLGHALLDDNLDNVVLITSSNTSDTPAPDTYTSISKSLTIAGLEEDATRSVTVDYKTERDDDLLGTIQPFMPFFISIMLFAVGAGMAYLSWKRG